MPFGLQFLQLLIVLLNLTMHKSDQVARTLLKKFKTNVTQWIHLNIQKNRGMQIHLTMVFQNSCVPPKC